MLLMEFFFCGSVHKTFSIHTTEPHNTTEKFTLLSVWGDWGWGWGWGWGNQGI